MYSETNHKNRTGKLRGGVGLFIGKEFGCSLLTAPAFSSSEYIIINVRWSYQNLNMVSIYRTSNAGCSVFPDEFMSFIGLVTPLSSQTVILGDFNIHIETNANNILILETILDSCNVTQHMAFATHIHGHTLDYILTSSDFCGIDGIMQPGLCQRSLTS